MPRSVRSITAVPEWNGGDAGIGRRRPARTPARSSDRLGGGTAAASEYPTPAAPAGRGCSVPPLAAELRRLIEWTADYYLRSLASVARMVLASGALRRPGD